MGPLRSRRLPRGAATAVLSLLALSSAATAIPGCGNHDATALVIALGKDSSTAYDTVKIVATRGGTVSFSESYQLGADGEIKLPGTLTFESSADDADDTVRYDIFGSLGENGAPVIRRSAALGFVKEKTKLLKLRLEDVCLDMLCGDPASGLTCIGGHCVSDVVDVSALPDFTDEADAISGLSSAGGSGGSGGEAGAGGSHSNVHGGGGGAAGASGQTSGGAGTSGHAGAAGKGGSGGANGGHGGSVGASGTGGTQGDAGGGGKGGQGGQAGHAGQAGQAGNGGQGGAGNGGFAGTLGLGGSGGVNAGAGGGTGGVAGASGGNAGAGGNAGVAGVAGAGGDAGGAGGDAGEAGAGGSAGATGGSGNAGTAGAGGAQGVGGAAGATATTFQLGAAQTVPVGGNGYFLASADFNADGKPDIAFLQYNGELTVFFNATVTGSSSAMFVNAGSHSTSGSAFSLSARDVTGDGSPDILVTSYAGPAVEVFENQTPALAGTVTLGSSAAIVSPGGDPDSIDVADLDGDGRLDLALALRSNDIETALGTSAKGADPYVCAGPISALATNAPSPNAGVLKIVDLNDDGKPDILTANYEDPASFSVLMNTTTVPGTFTSSLTANVPGLGGLAQGAATGDLNGDGILDVAVVNEVGASGVYVVLSTTAGGSSTFTGGAPISIVGGPAYYSAIEIIDMNGDSIPDIVVQAGGVLVWLNHTPPGSTSLSLDAPMIFGSATYHNGVLVDVNGDGLPDVVGSTSSGFDVFLNASQ